jgi:hypothetical protein
MVELLVAQCKSSIRDAAYISLENRPLIGLVHVGAAPICFEADCSRNGESKSPSEILLSSDVIAHNHCNRRLREHSPTQEWV